MLLERPFAQDAAVADAVQRHAAGQAQVLHARSARARAGPARSMISSVTAWIEAARSISRCVSGDLGPARRAAEQARRTSARSSSGPGSS